MSDTPNRRHEDLRMDSLEQKVEKIDRSMSRVEKKIFNGFGDSIQHTQDKVDYIDERNREAHGYLIDLVNGMSKKFDKVLFIWVSGTITIIVGVVIAVVKDLI